MIEIELTDGRHQFDSIECLKKYQEDLKLEQQKTFKEIERQATEIVDKATAQGIVITKLEACLGWSPERNQIDEQVHPLMALWDDHPDLTVDELILLYRETTESVD